VSPSSSPVADTEFLQDLLKTLGLGVAVADRESWEIVFENAQFFNWFGPDEEVDAGLNRRLPGFDSERAATRLEKGRAYKLEAESGEGARKVPIEVTVRHVLEGAETALLVVDWTIPGAEMSGTATDVARRQPDGTWRCVIDNPHGGAVSVDLRPDVADVLSG